MPDQTSHLKTMKSSVEFLLEGDHESLGQLLTELDSALTDVNVSRSFELLDLFWARLAVHIRAENLHLFPALANAPPSLLTGKDRLPSPDDVQKVLEDLSADHNFFMKELAEMIRVMRDMTANQRANAEEVDDLRQRLMTITSRLETHNELEETQAYRWVDLLFDAQTADDLGKRIQHELENLPPRLNKRSG
jgi:hypothetical protein